MKSPSLMKAKEKTFFGSWVCFFFFIVCREDVSKKTLGED